MGIKPWLISACLMLAACDIDTQAPHPQLDEAVLEETEPAVSPVKAIPPGQYAAKVASFKPGLGSGYGASKMPQVVLGPPKGKGTLAGSMDVLSLGIGGEITLDFSSHPLVDKPGDDFIVFENAFWPADNPEAVFAELGEVAVSRDGTEWHVFRCYPAEAESAVWPGCAGWTPTLA